MAERGTTEERLAAMKAARETKLAAQKAARPDARTAMAAKAEAAQLAQGKAFAERQIAQNPDTGSGGLVGSSVAKWMYDPKTGKKRTAQEIVDAVVEAVLTSDDPRLRGVSLDPLTGQPRPSTDQQKVEAALAQLASNAQFEGTRLGEAFEVSQLLRGSGRGGSVKALANRPDLWALGKETVGTIIDRKSFDDARSVKRFVLDPTKNQLTPEQLKQYQEIGAAGGMAIDPITGGQVLIDQQGRYTLGEQPEGDVTGLDFSTYQGRYTPPNYNPMRLFGGDEPDNLGAGGTGGTGGMGGAGFGGGTLTPTGSLPGGVVSGTASDVFKQTLAVFFGPSEVNKPWVNQLYSVVSRFTKQGATSEEAFNMAVLDSEKNPALADFTKRFKGIYALQKMKQEGKAVTVPTVAEYFATESKMGDVLKQSSLGDLANEDFLGDVLAKGVSATEFANRITAIFDRIDNSPKEIKDTLSRFFPTVDRISLAKAIALGDKGAKELQAKVTGYEVLSAAEKQGLGASQLAGGVTEERAYQYALGGETFDTALTKFGTVAAALPTVNKLTQIYGEPMLGPSGIEEAIFGKSAKQIKALEDLSKREEASFSGRSGLAPTALASQRRGAGLI